MNDVTPTKSALLELKDERRAMQEGHTFLDEKCLLLAAEMLRELARHDALAAEAEKLHARAGEALAAAIARHGLNGLQCYPAADLSGAALRITRRTLMGVALLQAEFSGSDAPPAGANSFAHGRMNPALPTNVSAPAINPSPEAEACREAHARILRHAAGLAAVSGNLERLYREYRRTARRMRALADVLLPETEQIIRDFENRLEEMEQEEALWLRRARG